ncbi:predicted protein [Nematostella vectensis]|uniref:Cytochrome b5 heme-binding domain-containing protein n=1 Tax=Nematostella vectensis TaxID=45351 RepID=A7SKQ4_NEMVE|nr:predicted protein [Nematostella vectensis]|eukprot:XP_001627811.1 predicted protein [Nematostella vectensis]
MTRIPRPFPSADDLPEFHYKNVHSTPLTDSKGNDRGPDDWQPRANIKKLFEQKKLSLEDNEEIKKFSQAFIVDEKYVRSYLEHLSSLETISKIREKQRKDARQERKKKEVSDYNWQELIENGKLPSLVVSELDKYLIHYNLSKTGKKKDKIRRITVHYYNQDRRAVPDDQPVADFDQQFGSEEFYLKDNNRKVYDATSYIRTHPGGLAIIRNCGGDATEGFNSQPSHGVVRTHINNLLSKMYIGKLQQ